MPEYLRPGVFVEERPSGSMPIEGVGVNTCAFIGYAKSGPFGKPTFVSGWADFCSVFGEEENAYLVALSDLLKLTPPEVLEKKETSRKNWTEFAQDKVSEEFKAGRYKPKDPKNPWKQFVTDNAISQDRSPYIEYTALPDAAGDQWVTRSYLAHALRGYFDNGGGRAYVARVARAGDMAAHVGKDVKTNAPLKTVAGTPIKAYISDQEAVKAVVTSGPLKFEAAKEGEDGNELYALVEPGAEAKPEEKGADGKVTSPAKPGSFKVTLLQETAEGPKTLDTKTVTALKGETKFKDLLTLTIADDADALARISKEGAGEVRLAGGADAPLPVALGDVSKAEDFDGDEVKGTGRRGLSLYEDINMICAPDLMAEVFRRKVYKVAVPNQKDKQTRFDKEQLNDKPGNGAGYEDWKGKVYDAQTGMVGYCDMINDRMAILDAPPKMTPQQVKNEVFGDAGNFGCSNGQAALYYPWVQVTDPIHQGERLYVPPCGHVAGVWARVGSERGVHKAPANETLRGVVDLERIVSNGDQELLNPVGINCLRTFPGMGIRIWGARTLSTTSNQSYKYVNVRRLINYIKKSLDQGLQWAVFEPNDDDLWARVRRNVSAFLWTEWKEGKLFGLTPEEAFSVKCDRTTNPAAMRDLGRLYVDIGVNPVKPAEFVIVSIGQWDGGSSMEEKT